MKIPTAFATSQNIRIDGNIYTAAGAPVTGTRNIIIKAYAAASGGAALWTSTTFTNTAVTNGRFSVSLDASNGLTQAWSDASGSLWFEITVGSDIVKPRIQAKGSMFAIAAATADRIRNYSVSTLAPATGDVLTWNGGAWAPAAASGGGSYVAKSGDSMTGRLKMPAGSNTAPSIDFVGATTGIFSTASGDILHFAVQGNDVVNMTSDGGVFSNYSSNTTTTAASPGYTFYGGTTASGLYMTSGGTMGLSTAGAARLTFSSGGVINIPGLTASRLLRLDGSNNLTSVTSSPTDAQLGYLVGVTAPIQTQINAAIAGTGFVAKAGDSMSGTLSLAAGSVTAPSLNWGDADTGLYRSASHELSISTGGNQRISIASGGTATFTAPVQVNNFLAATGSLSAGTQILTTGLGTASQPAFFIGSNNWSSGLFAPTDGDVAVSTGGSMRLNVTSAGLINVPVLTASRALITDGSSNLATSSTTSTELGYLSGVTAALQTQINNLSTSAGNGTFVHLTGDSMTGALNFPLSTAVTFGDTSTGILASVTGEVRIVNSGNLRVQVWNNGIGLYSTAIINKVNAGNNQAVSTTTPVIYMNGETGVGILHPVSGAVGIATASTERIRFASDGSINVPGFTASRALTTDGSSNLTVSSTTSTELGYLSGTTANVQTQINSLASSDASTYVKKAGDTMTGNLTLGNGTNSGNYRLYIPWVSGDTMSTMYVGSTNGANYQNTIEVNSYGGYAVHAVSMVAQAVLASSSTAPAVEGDSSSNSGVVGFSGSGYGVEGKSISSTSGHFRSTDATNTAATLVSRQRGTASANLLEIQNDGGTALVAVGASGAVNISALTASRLVRTDGSQNLTSVTSNPSDAELGYLSGVTASIQTQINNVSSNSATTYVAKAGDTMTGALRVNAQIYTPSGTGLDFSTSNVQYGSNDCSSTVALSNMQDGGSYTWVNTDTGTNVCAFSHGTDTFKYKGNSARTGTTVFSFIKANGIIYTSVITGF